VRIRSDERIAGYPAVQVRQLMRETVGRSITHRYVREILSCSNSTATRVLSGLEQAGFIESLKGYWEATTKGSALAMATAAPPLTRETANRLVADLVHRARDLNADDRWSVRLAENYGGRLSLWASLPRLAVSTQVDKKYGRD